MGKVIPDCHLIDVSPVNRHQQDMRGERNFKTRKRDNFWSYMHGDVPDRTTMPKEQPMNYVRWANTYKVISLCVLSSTIFTSTAKCPLHDAQM